jgi:tetratricopeptide (TPR) repeat protein
VALLLAGWLAGRGPLADASAPPVVAGAETGGAPGRPPWAPPLWRERLAELGRVRIAVAVGVLAAALLAAWSQWQPQRSEDARLQAITLVASDPQAALASAHTAVARDPLSVQALFALSAVEQAAGQAASARATLQQAVKLQPSNPETWLHLGLYEVRGNPRMALSDLEAVIYLDPQSVAPELITGPRATATSIELQNAYIQALRATAATAPLKSGIAPLGRAGGVAPKVRPRARPPLRSESPPAAP